MKVFVFLAVVTLMLASCKREPSLDLHKSDGQKSYEEFMAGITGTRYEAPEERKQNIFSNYSRLRVGMTKQEIASIIGTPDYSQASYGPKGPGEKWLGWSWGYYLVWPDTRFVNEAQDKRAQIFFDTQDRATWISPSSKTPLPQLGGPGELCLTDRTSKITLCAGGQGIWPAFWLLGENISRVGWPECGEIDVMENIGREPSTVHGTLHGPGYSGGNGLTGSVTLPNGEAFTDAFHTFAVEWGAARYQFLCG